MSDVRTNPSRNRFAARLSIGLVLASLLAGCGFLSRDQLDNFSLTYRISVQQGIVVTQEMAEQLKVGMSRDQVKFVLGTPILSDPFHAERWDYPFRFQPGRGRTEMRRFTVYFANDRLARFDGDPLPTEEEFAASRNFATTRIAKAPPLAGSALPAPASNATGIGSTTVTPSPVKLPTRTGTPGDSTSPPPPSEDSGTTR